MKHDTLFAFEQDFAASLRCIPMAVRLKLDVAGVKLSLRQWARMGTARREQLLRLPCATSAEIAAYQAVLAQAVDAQGEQVTSLPTQTDPPWMQPEPVPEPVAAYAASVHVPAPTQAQWAALAPLQRFVLIKLSRSKHDNVNFIPALREFGLLREPVPSRAAEDTDNG